MQQNSIFSSLRQALIYTLTAIGLILFIVMAMTAVATSKDKQFVNGKQHQPFIPYRLTGQVVSLAGVDFTSGSGLSQVTVTSANSSSTTTTPAANAGATNSRPSQVEAHPAVKVTADGRHQYQARNVQAMIQQARHRHQL